MLKIYLISSLFAAATPTEFTYSHDALHWIQAQAPSINDAPGELLTPLWFSPPQIRQMHQQFFPQGILSKCYSYVTGYTPSLETVIMDLPFVKRIEITRDNFPALGPTFDQLFNVLINPQIALEGFHLYNIEKPDMVAVALADALRGNRSPQLKSLLLTGNRFSFDNIRFLAQALNSNTKLESLSLIKCNLTDLSLPILLEGIKSHPTLEFLDISLNQELTLDSLDSILELFQQNDRIRIKMDEQSIEHLTSHANRIVQETCQIL